MEYVFSIIMAAMGVGLLLMAAYGSITGVMYGRSGAYGPIKRIPESKRYVRCLSKIIALIGASFLLSSLVGLTQIYWLAVVVLVGGIVATCILGKRIMKNAKPDKKQPDNEE
jgi:dipeptide/tripeptide permease